MSTKIILLCTMVFITACTPIIKDYDAEKMEAEHIAKISAAQKKDDPFNSPRTPKYVHVKNEDGIFVDVYYAGSRKGTQNINLETWKATARNDNSDAKCVLVAWKLQDFAFESSLPSEFLIKGKQTLDIATMHQTIWSFDSTAIALPPSGYVDTINVRDPDINKRDGREECVLDESSIQEPK